MTPTTFSRRGLHGNVVDVLGHRIVSGAIAEGEIIDPEGLEHELGVSRTVIREAVKVLTTKGLLDAKPRLGTFVQPRANWNLLDADLMRWRSQDGPDRRLLTELDEVRQIVEPSGARLAAARRTEDDVASIGAALDRMRAAGSDAQAHVAADLAFHRAVLMAAKNEMLDRLEVVLAPALQARDTLAFGHPHTGRFIDAHAAVYDAVRAQDGESAATAMAMLLREAAEDTERILRRQRRR